MNKNTILSVLMVFLIASSGFVGAVGSVSAQTTDSGGESVAVKCVDSVEGWGVLVPAVGVYQCIDGVFSPDDYDSSTELENEAWNQAVSIQDYTEQRNTEYQNWNDRSLSASLLEAEKPLIEAHYAEKSEADARSAASEQIREYYSGQISSAYNANNQVYERAVSISKSTNADSNIDTPVIQFRVSHDGAMNYPYQSVLASATQDTTLGYTSNTLPNGDAFDVVTTIKDVKLPDGFSGTIGSNWALKHVDTDDDGTKDQYNVQVTPDTTAESVIIANDPYSDETREITWQSDHTTRINEIKNERNQAQGEVETMATDLYSTHSKGTINPENYVSGATLLEEYSQNDSHYSYSAAKAAVTGLNTDLDAQQIVQINGDTSTEYEGMILTGSEGPQLADHEVSTNAVFSNSSKVLQWDSGTTGQDTLTVTGGSTTSYYGDSSSPIVITKPDITPDGAETPPDFELINNDMEPIDGGSSAVPIKTITITYGNNITVTDDVNKTTAMGASGTDATFSRIDDSTVEISFATGFAETVLIQPDVTLDRPGESSFDLTVTDDTGTQVYTESGALTIDGDVTTAGTIDAVRQADSSGVSISDDGSSATIQQSAVDDYALIDVSDGNTYVAYANQTAADSGIPTGFEVGTQYDASNFGSVMLTYQSGDKVETLREDTINTFTILSASSASSGEEISVLDYSDGGQRTFTDTSNIREELENQQEVQDAINSRGDVDPAGAGGSVEQRLQDGLLGFGVGATVIVFIGGFVVVLWLVGRITSFA